jgi:hypothetical protein
MRFAAITDIAREVEERRVEAALRSRRASSRRSSLAGAFRVAQVALTALGRRSSRALLVTAPTLAAPGPDGARRDPSAPSLPREGHLREPTASGGGGGGGPVRLSLPVGPTAASNPTARRASAWMPPAFDRWARVRSVSSAAAAQVRRGSKKANPL